MGYQYNDYELVYKVKENDDVSRDLLTQKYMPIVCQLATEYYKGFGHYGYDYDDFVQEASIGFYKSIYSYDEKKGTLFYTFVLLCVRRALISFCRDISSTQKCISSSCLKELDDNILVDSKSNIDLFVRDSLVQELLKKIIFDLSLEDGAVLELKSNGFSYREISILLDIPFSSAEFRGRRAKNKFKRAYDKLFL